MFLLFEGNTFRGLGDTKENAIKLYYLNMDIDYMEGITGQVSICDTNKKKLILVFDCDENKWIDYIDNGEAYYQLCPNIPKDYNIDI